MKRQRKPAMHHMPLPGIKLSEIEWQAMPPSTRALLKRYAKITAALDRELRRRVAAIRQMIDTHA